MVIIMNEMDERDLSILECLKANSRRSEKKVAKATRIPMTTVHNRIKRMIEDGVITGFTVNIDYSKLSKPIVAYVMVKAGAKADQEKLLEYISKKPGVFESAMITGEFDLLFKTRVADMAELNRLVVQDIRKHPLVADTHTMISYHTIEN